MRKFTTDLICCVCLSDTRTVNTPMELHLKLCSTNGEPLFDPTRYCQLADDLIYLIIFVWTLCMSYVVSQFVSVPRFVYYIVVLRILHYLWGLLTRFLFLLLLHWSFVLKLMLIGSVILPINVLLLTFVSFLMTSLVSWKIKKIIWWLILLRRLSGFVFFSLTWVSHSILLLCYILIIRVISRWLKIQFSTSRSVTLIFMFSLSHTFPLQSSLRTSSLRLTPLHVFSIY